MCVCVCHADRRKPSRTVCQKRAQLHSTSGETFQTGDGLLLHGCRPWSVLMPLKMSQRTCSGHHQGGGCTVQPLTPVSVQQCFEPTPQKGEEESGKASNPPLPHGHAQQPTMSMCLDQGILEVSAQHPGVKVGWATCPHHRFCRCSITTAPRAEGAAQGHSAVPCVQGSVKGSSPVPAAPTAARRCSAGPALGGLVRAPVVSVWQSGVAAIARSIDASTHFPHHLVSGPSPSSAKRPAL